MAALATSIRKKLEGAVKQARRVAEVAARSALDALAVQEAAPFPHMDEPTKQLRHHLRARARQLGDVQTPEGKIRLGRVIHECAYEHWHRMIFARFLAENRLLIEPESNVAISLDDCKELAAAEKTDLWTYASRCAQRMLPDIFRPSDPLLQVTLAREHRLKLEGILAGLDSAVFTADDALGWVYQFWRADEKDAVNKAGDKINADTLPAVTQLFTEHYMVDFLLDNTLGAWHAGKVLAANPKLAEPAPGEDELRHAVSLPGCPWKYLRFIKGQDGKWTPAAGTFDGWPKAAQELRCLDPCMGSGHFVVAMFERLVALRMAEEKLDEKAAVVAVIRDNLFGLELDPRCTQIGAFNLALAAWRRVGHCALPAMNLACSGLAPNTREADWLALAGDDQKLQGGMERLFRLFTKAAVLGSLINPRAGEGDLLVAAFHELQPLLEKALAQEARDDTAHELAVTARGLAKAAEILAGQFTLVATNVPYLGISKHPEEMLNFIEERYEVAKYDLATVFLERMRELLQADGVIAAVTLGEWLYLGPYLDYRMHFLRTCLPLTIVRLGWNAFSTPIRANPALVIASGKPSRSASFGLVDGSSSRTVERNRLTCLEGTIDSLSIAQVEKNPDSRFLNQGEGDADVPLLSACAEARSGLHAGDLHQFFRFFWEVAGFSSTWEAIQTAVNDTAAFAGREQIIRWEKEEGTLAALAESVRHLNHAAQNWRAGKPFWGKQGVIVGLMGKAACGLYSGDRYDVNSSAIVPKNEIHLTALWCFCESGEFSEQVRRLDNSLKLSPQTLLKVSFDLAHWQKVAAEKYPHGLPKPFSSDPTQWLFNGHPAGADQPLQVAVARLLGYQWPRLTGSSFPDCPALGPDGLEKFADADGIVCLSAIHGEAAAADRLQRLLAAAWNSPPPEAPARVPEAGGQASEGAAQASKGTAQAPEGTAQAQEATAFPLQDLLAGVGYGHKTLDDWLRDKFFEQHCALFHQRPFIWHIWDGQPRGFSALVNYHRLAAPAGAGRKLLEKLTYTYLGDWISRQTEGVRSGAAGADDRLAAATELKKRLGAILAGEPPFDVFARWKPLHQQPIGWEPDVNDGVRVNIRPFMASDLPNGKRDAGILRHKPNVKWDKDRGKEPHRLLKEFPWFWDWDGQAEDFPGGDKFTGDRWNDCHYTTKAKHAAFAVKETKP
jgi:hypothetical protein